MRKMRNKQARSTGSMTDVRYIPKLKGKGARLKTLCPKCLKEIKDYYYYHECSKEN